MDPETLAPVSKRPVSHFFSVQRNGKLKALTDAYGNYIYDESDRYLAVNINKDTDKDYERSKAFFAAFSFLFLCINSLVISFISIKAGIGIFVIGSLLFFSRTLALITFVIGILFLI